MSKKIQIISGNSSTLLAKKVADELQIPCDGVRMSYFPDGEIEIKDIEIDPDGQIFVIASTGQPADNTLELLFLLKELQNRGANDVTAVISYLGFNRQDRRILPGDGLLAEHMISLIASAGVKKVILVDVHTQKTLQLFKDKGVDVAHLELLPQILPEVAARWGTNLVIVGPDAGSENLAKECADVIGVEYCTLLKKRDAEGSVVRDIVTLDLDVAGRDVVLVDDMLDTAGTIVSAASIIKKNGARKIYTLVTHGLFSDPATQRLLESEVDSIGTSDTVLLQKKLLQELEEKIEVFSSSKVIAAAIQKECANNSDV